MGYIGESFAFLTAICMVTASTLFSDIVKKCSPLSLNLLRGLVAIALTVVTLYFFSDTIFPHDSLRNYLLLIFSGFLGISVGDTLYFTALEYIGARQTILLETLAPPFTGIISYFYFGQTLSFIGWVGIFLICIGIIIVVYEKEEVQLFNKDNNDNFTTIELPILKNMEIENINILSNTEEGKKGRGEEVQQIQEDVFIDFSPSDLLHKSKKFVGFACGIGFTICQSMGLVLSYDGMSSGKFSSFQSVLVRIIASTLGIAIILFFKRGEKFSSPCKTQNEYVMFFITCFISLFIGIWAQQTSILYTKPEISQSIIATTPLLSLVICWYKGEEMKQRYIYGSLLTVIGVNLLVCH